MKRVLLVVSSYAPAMIADMQRARQLAWELPAFGWEVEVLAPDRTCQFVQTLDHDSDAFFCPDTSAHHAQPESKILPKGLRPGTIGWRSLSAMNAAGSGLIARDRFDLVYFSTTQFPLFLLGPLWRARFGVPYVLDFQDPIRRDGPATWQGRDARTRAKQWASRVLSYGIEALAVQSASAVIAVSQEYVQVLCDRYAKRKVPWIAAGRYDVIPFSASDRDMSEARISMKEAGASPGDPRRIVYVGAGGQVMMRSFRALCVALQVLMQRRGDIAGKIRIELYGTMFGWQIGGRRELAEIAASCGIADLVQEDPRRVTYRSSLELLLGADGALVLGVDDAGYMPSKLYTYALSGKPLLAVLRRDSAGARAFGAAPALGQLMSFGDENDGRAASRALEEFVDEVLAGRTIERQREGVLASYLSREMARRHATLFDSCLAARDGPGKRDA